ncbi:Ig domain-containing protein [Amnibacterium soli]
MTGALAAGMLGSAPAFADGATVEVHNVVDLKAALAGSATSITLEDGFDTDPDPSGSAASTTVDVSKTLDLNGASQVNLDQLTVNAGIELDIVDSTSVDGSVGDGSVHFNADSSATTPTSGVQLGHGASFHVSGATVFSTGADGGAGIGSDGGDASFAADGGAVVWAYGSDLDSDNDHQPDGGGAGIGGSHGDAGIDVTIGKASVHASGGAGAAGIGGGDHGNGGRVHLASGAGVTAEQGPTIQPAFIGASSIGGGQSAAQSGALQIDSDVFFQVSNGSPLLLLPGADFVNDGSIYLDGSNGSGNAIDGSGTIENHGSITADGDPTALIGHRVAVKGYNYDLTVVPNGGTIAGATHANLLSGSVSGLVPFYGGVTAPSDDTLFWKWTTQADGSGTIVPQTYSSTDDLTAVGTSIDGTAVPVTLYAQYGHVPAGTQDTLPDAVVGRPYDQQLPVSGEGITSYTVAGPQSSSDQGSVLPAGLSIDSTTGRITGTPTAAFDGDVTFDVIGVGENLITFHLTVGGAPVFATAGLPGGTAGEYYGTQVAVGGNDDTSYSIVSGALPSGLSLGSTGYISGTPTAAASASFTVRATSRFGSTDRAFTIAIGAAAPVASRPVLGAAPRASVKFGHQLTLAVAAESASPLTFKLIGGGLPKGVALNARTGVITGAPTESGTFTVRVRVANKDGYEDAFVVITVSKQVDLIKAKPVAPVTVGAAVVPVKVSGFQKGEHWTVKVDGKVVKRGTVKKAGALSVSVKLKKASKDKVHTIVVSGSRKVTDPAKRAATVLTVTSLSAKKALKLHSVSGQDGRKYVAVEKLAAGEHVVVKDGAKTIASGRASEYGIFVFPQAKAGKGTSKLTVHGATAKRAGKLTVKNPKH